MTRTGLTELTGDDSRLKEYDKESERGRGLIIKNNMEEVRLADMKRLSKVRKWYG